MEAEIAFGSLIEHYPDLALAVDTSQLEKQERMQLPGHWRLARLPVILNGR
jgi:hypothetical protein